MPRNTLRRPPAKPLRRVVTKALMQCPAVRHVSQDIGGNLVPVAPKWAGIVRLTKDIGPSTSGWRASLGLIARYSSPTTPA